jgi:hypothetical protein
MFGSLLPTAPEVAIMPAGTNHQEAVVLDTIIQTEEADGLAATA